MKFINYIKKKNTCKYQDNNPTSSLLESHLYPPGNNAGITLIFSKLILQLLLVLSAIMWLLALLFSLYPYISFCCFRIYLECENFYLMNSSQFIWNKIISHLKFISSNLVLFRFLLCHCYLVVSYGIWHNRLLGFKQSCSLWERV